MCNEHGIFCNVSSTHVHQIINASLSPPPRVSKAHSHRLRGGTPHPPITCMTRLQTHAEDPQACRSVFIREQAHINIAHGDRPRPTSDIRAGWPYAPQTQAPPGDPPKSLQEWSLRDLFCFLFGFSFPRNTDIFRNAVVGPPNSAPFCFLNETSRPLTKPKAPETASHRALSTDLARDRLEAAVPAPPAAAVNFPRGTWRRQRVPGDPGGERDTEIDDPRPRDGRRLSTARTGNDMGSWRDRIKTGPPSSILSSKI